MTLVTGPSPSHRGRRLDERDGMRLRRGGGRRKTDVRLDSSVGRGGGRRKMNVRLGSRVAQEQGRRRHRRLESRRRWATGLEGVLDVCQALAPVCVGLGTPSLLPELAQLSVFLDVCQTNPVRGLRLGELGLLAELESGGSSVHLKTCAEERVGHV